MDDERYFLLNKDEDFPPLSLYGLEYKNGVLSLIERGSRGLFVSGVLDSLEDGCRWKRARLGCELPEGAGVNLRFYSADNESEAERLANLLWETGGVDSIQTDRELEKYECFAIEGSRDFPLSAARGRYLAFAMELISQAGASPEIRFVQLWCREESFLNYLPEIYRKPGGFLDRFLQIFALQYFDVERDIERLPESFDPRTASPERLAWLAWLAGVEHAELWPRSALRTFLAEGIYKAKGTFSGLRRTLELLTDGASLIVESFGMKTGIHENDVLYAGKTLLILILNRPPRSPAFIMTLHMIIKAWIPAGVTYSLIMVPDSVILSRHSYLGINSVISDYEPAYLDGPGGLEYIVLGEHRP